MLNNKMTGNVLLFFTAFIWGSTFTACVIGLKILPANAFNAFRYMAACLMILALVVGKDIIKNIKYAVGCKSVLLSEWKESAPGGTLCGIMLFAGSALQQMGLQHSEATKTAFITVLYIVIVPVFSFLTGKRITLKTWIAVVISIVGFYFLTIRDSFNIEIADGLVFAGAFFWAFHILCCDHFVSFHDSLKMSCIQFATAFILSSVCAVFFEKLPSFNQLIQAVVPVIFAGPLAMGVGFTLQMIAQKVTEPSVASLILSAESVFAAIAGYFFLGEVLSQRELLGCVMIFVAILLVQINVELPYIKCPPKSRHEISNDPNSSFH